MSAQLPLDLAAAEQARDKGIATTTIRNLRWIAGALTDLATFAAGRDTFAMEEYRQHRDERGLEHPATHHAWGALAQVAAKRHIIAFTGQYVPARSKRTHAHPVKLWRRAA